MTKSQLKIELLKIIDENIETLSSEIITTVMQLRAQIEIKLKD